MNNLEEVLEGVRTVGIGGHVRPDGDCVGSCTAVYLYLKKWFPQIQTDLYLESRRDVFSYLAGFDEIRTEPEEGKIYDLFITCDVSAMDRLAVAEELFRNARRTVCIDHHVSNMGFADVDHIRGDIGSACEVLYSLMDKEKIEFFEEYLDEIDADSSVVNNSMYEYYIVPLEGAKTNSAILIIGVISLLGGVAWTGLAFTKRRG